ncbi:DUF4374 domain-containing protein [Hoylesella oralis]|uniref:DUF4374 domain-containing protein n=1 Tax=Hoylesella oralis TaxID=28134 RepID=UPI0028E23477|nr:DUF4374 domain-containing protein [Hoylesella oralis]
MNSNNFKLNSRLIGALFIAASAVFTACGSDSSVDGGDNPVNPTPDPSTPVEVGKGPYVIGVKASAGDGREYVIQTTSISRGNLNLKQNIKELEQSDYTWVFHKDIAVGFAYGYASAGYGYAMKLVSEQEKLKDLRDFRIEPRYTSYGFFNNQLVTMVGGQTGSDGKRNDLAVFTIFDISENGVAKAAQKTIYTKDITGNGQQITFSGIADNGDGTFMTAAVESDFKDVGVGDGSSIGTVKYPDSVWVAKMDKNMNVVRLYGDDRLSFAAGRWHAQNFNEVFKTDGTDTTYVFSSAIDATTTRHAGALRIVKSIDGFDKGYYWDIQADFNNYKFRRVWHVTDDVFLIEFYNDYNPGNTSVAHQYALADMSEKKLTKITGLPAKNLIKSGEQTAGAPLYDEGVLYLPITEYGSDAIIYSIDLHTGTAKKGITLTGVGEVRNMGRLRVR